MLLTNVVRIRAGAGPAGAVGDIADRPPGRLERGGVLSVWVGDRLRGPTLLVSQQGEPVLVLSEVVVARLDVAFRRGARRVVLCPAYPLAVLVVPLFMLPNVPLDLSLRQVPVAGLEDGLFVEIYMGTGSRGRLQLRPFSDGPFTFP